MANENNSFAGIPNIRFEYYAIDGGTPAELYAAMQARAPKEATDGGGVARTVWNFRVGWREMRRGDRCEVADPLASLSITVILPRLDTTSDVSPEGLAFWRAAIAGLEIHEAGHARIAWDHRNDFSEAAADAGCKSIGKVARQVQARIAAIQEAYDRDTRHGIAQMPPIER